MIKNTINPPTNTISSLSASLRMGKSYATMDMVSTHEKPLLFVSSFDADTHASQVAGKDPKAHMVTFETVSVSHLESKTPAFNIKKAGPSPDETHFQEYWLVWNTQSNYRPNVVHWSEKSAIHEAERLARHYRGESFMVLKTRSQVSLNDVKVTRKFE